ncbi:hypothetical protein scyTo_0011018 [Scyliorhinus torazame]|uniref:G-protein coupled receptors family 1 profile domain-containing protein n=1 Tax=Scyliorhinus torazame TaxID=75743 RepID=A0A401NGJ4_SCYTO|nr:hypothetical protein [Scyliorhinus torazame]
MLKKMNSSLGLPYSNFPLAEHLMKNNLSLYLPDAFLHEDLGNLENILLTIREPSTIALTVMYSISFAVGFVGNIMSIKVLTSKRNNRMTGVSATRSLLINLAVCDLMVVCVCMPTTLGYQIYKAWIYGDFMCRAAPFTQAVSVSASVLSITVISVNRVPSSEMRREEQQLEKISKIHFSAALSAYTPVTHMQARCLRKGRQFEAV